MVNEFHYFLTGLEVALDQMAFIEVAQHQTVTVDETPFPNIRRYARYANKL